MKSLYISFTASVQTAQTSRLRSVLADAINSGHDDIHIFISSVGGDVFEGISTGSFIRALSVSVSTYNIGQIDSVANVIFAAGKKRYAQKNASFLFHEVTMNLNPNVTENQIHEAYKNVQRLRESIAAAFATYTGLKTEEISALMSASGGGILTANEALAKKIVNEIKEPVIPPGVQIVSINNA